MKRILFFIESLGCGGAEKSILALLHSLDYSKVRIDLLLLSDKGVFTHNVPPEVNIIRLPGLRGWRSLPMRLGHLAFSARTRINRLLGKRRHSAEALWVTEGRLYPALPGHYDVAIAYQQGLPTYYVAEKVNADRKLTWANVDLKGAGYRAAFNRRFYDRYDSVVAVSRSLVPPLVDDGFTSPDKVNVIYDILSEKLIREMAEERPETPVDRGKTNLLIVTVGRMTPQKNYLLAVEAAAVLRDRGVDFKWVFVGSGTEEASVRQRISQLGLEEIVVPVGMKTNPYPYIKQADLYVHTASFEGYGLTIAEAKILGKPVVSTNFTVVTDQITDGVNGLITEMTPESVAAGIMRMAGDAALRDTITRNVKAETNTTQATEVDKFYRLAGCGH